MKCSVKGEPYHNHLALDKSHECLINKKLKQLTSRPSEHRTETLANFMANLEQFKTTVSKALDNQQYNYHDS